MKRRFSVEAVHRVCTYRGVITVADIRRQFSIPDDAVITVRVPSGGDYSGEDIDLTEIHVSWEQVK